jgi:biotin synthase
LVLPEDPSLELLRDLLSGGGPDEVLFRSSHLKLLEEMGGQVYLRGLVEISNICRKNCFYCGLRRDNTYIDRYSMRPAEIMGSLRRGYRQGLRSFLLQSGEFLGEEHIEMVAGILRKCSSTMPGARMVLSLGELPEEIYDRLRKAGGHRYLLRIETSSPELYRHFHPDDPLHSHGSRLRALEYLRDSGWQTGTGVLIGLPGQTAADLAEDILFMKRMDMDMVGMGPYIESPDTPLLDRADEILPAETRTILTLRMIALARLALPGVNIAATTALQTLSNSGLERGLLAGANVIMPNLTPERYRESYSLYTGKTRAGDTPSEMMDALRVMCLAIGRELKLYDPGDPPHYRERTGRGGYPDDDR